MKRQITDDTETDQFKPVSKRSKLDKEEMDSIIECKFDNIEKMLGEVIQLMGEVILPLNEDQES